MDKIRYYAVNVIAIVLILISLYGMITISDYNLNISDDTVGYVAQMGVSVFSLAASGIMMALNKKE